MGIFLRIRDAYAKRTSETEGSIVDELSKCRLLVIDEIQERSSSEWEDRIITHIIDRRYGATLPTIIIGNLTPEFMEKNLGESIVSRVSETGGIIEMTGKSHRILE
jgi:DNA replication protein DnaC